jgi:hypothetical protein
VAAAAIGVSPDPALFDVVAAVDPGQVHAMLALHA